MTNHIALAAVGFAAFIFFALIAALTQLLHATGPENSYLKGRMLLARKIGLGWSEQLAQSQSSLVLQKWIAFALTTAALIFTIWHAILAIVSE